MHCGICIYLIYYLSFIILQFADHPQNMDKASTDEVTDEVCVVMITLPANCLFMDSVPSVQQLMSGTSGLPNQTILTAQIVLYYLAHPDRSVLKATINIFVLVKINASII